MATTEKARQIAVPPLLTTHSAWRQVILWIVMATVFAACGLIGLWQGIANYTMNAFIGGIAIIATGLVFAWLRSLERHRRRSDEIIRGCWGKSIQEIIRVDEADKPIALTILQGCGLKGLRNRGIDHTQLTSSLHQSLLRELSPFKRLAQVLPALGLAGTCLGIMDSLRQIGMGAENMADPDAFTAAISGALPAMALAISTTLAAAFGGSIVLAGVVDIAKNELHAFVNELEGQLDMFPFKSRKE